jgi:UDP-glucose 4-epimerase
MELLVTGGAGYIGSICARRLIADGHAVTVLDDFSRGHRDAVPEGARVAEASVAERDALCVALAPGFDAVLHFAALALVGESVEHPERYWRANVVGTLNLLDAMRDVDIRRLVFSSTCATYGEPDRIPITEETAERPESPYGLTKLVVDKMIGTECVANGLGAVSLRYFNVAGASGPLGEDHEPETHLIPNVLKVALGQKDVVEVYGTDYPTEDGTAVRDYIHIDDLADAHALALEKTDPGEHRILNLGNGSGFSVRQVIEAARTVTGHPIPVRDSPRRPGDPARLVAGSERIRSELGWTPRRPSIEEIIADAWAWYQAHPHGYGKRS